VKRPNMKAAKPARRFIANRQLATLSSCSVSDRTGVNVNLAATVPIMGFISMPQWICRGTEHEHGPGRKVLQRNGGREAGAGASVSNFFRSIIASDLEAGRTRAVVTRFPPEPTTLPPAWVTLSLVSFQARSRKHTQR
jgi:hypothetical protein